MTRKTNKSQSAVERLLDQQRQYQEWLHRLDDEAKHSAPSHVAERVRSDYAARLEAVTKELTEHVGAVRDALVQVTVRFEGLVKQKNARSDELAEAQLRQQVGEFDDEEFEEVSQRCKAALNELTREIATAERDMGRYEEILKLIEEQEEEEEEEKEDLTPARLGQMKEIAAAPPPPPPPSPPPVPAAPQPVAAAPAPLPPLPPLLPLPAVAAPPPAPVPEAPAQAAKGQIDALDELAFLRSVVSTPESPKAAAARPQQRISAPAIAPPPAPAPPPPPSPPPPPPPAPKAAPPPAPPRPAPPPPPRAKAVPEEGVEEFEEEEARRPAPAGDGRSSDGQVKTLKCTECGTMNLPTEWYCEKCGAELSAF